MGGRKFRIESYGLFEQFAGALIVYGGIAPHAYDAAEEHVICRQVSGAPAFCAFDFCKLQPSDERRHDGAS